MNLLRKGPIKIKISGKGSRFKLSPGMERIAEKAIETFNIPVERAHEPDFYLSDHLTGRPLIRGKAKRKVS